MATIPKAKIAKTAVAAVGLKTQWFEDTLGALKTGATDGDRILNRNLLYAKRDVVQVVLDHPDTLTESVRDANNRLKCLNKQINTETENLVLSQIKYDKQMERQRTT